MRTLEIRDVPEDVLETLRARASVSGRSLNDYVVDLLMRMTQLPTQDELMARVRQRGQVCLPNGAEVAAIRVSRTNR